MEVPFSERALWEENTVIVVSRRNQKALGKPYKSQILFSPSVCYSTFETSFSES